MKRFLLFLLAVVTGLTSYATDYKLVTDASQLEEGANYIVVGKDASENLYGMGAIKSTNRYAIVVTANNDVITIESEEVTPVALTKVEDATYPWAFKVLKTGKYLWAASTGSNHLKENDDLTVNATHASIQVAETGVATVKFNNFSNGSEVRNWLRFNYSKTSQLFSCYTSGQNDIYLYKEVTSTDPDPEPTTGKKVFMVSYSDQKRVELTQTTSGVYTASEVIMSLMSQGNANYGFYFSVASDGTTEDIYRPENNVDVECGTNYDVAVYQGEGTACWNIAAGVYDITFDLNEKQMSLTATEWTLVKDLGEFGNLIGGTKAYVENTAVAVAQQGKNLWIKDNSGWMLVFGDLGGVTYTNGDVIPALYGGYRSAYYGLPELADPIRGFVTATETVDAVQPQKIAAKDLDSTPLNSYVELRGKVTLDEGKTRNYTLTDETGSTAAIYTSSDNITVTTGEKVVVRGFVSIYMKDGNKTYRITPVESFEDRTPAAPSFRVPGGIVAKGTTVTLTGPEGATVKYQIDGESEAYTEYTEPIVINKNTTLRAIAELDGILSDAVAMKYQVRVSSAPVITPESGEIAAGTSLFINLPNDAPDGAAVFVKRIDDEGFWQYINTQHITIDAATTVTAVVAMPSVTSAGMDETDFIRSEEATATYTIATEPEPEDKLYMLGDIPGVDWDPTSDKVQLVKNTEGKYVIDEVTISDNNQGYGYFCFTTKLGDWDTVNANRYGPETKDAEVTVGETTAMTKSGYSWMIKAGTYKMVVDIDAMTFVATAVTPTVVLPEQLYIIGTVNNNNIWSPVGVLMTKVSDGIFRIDHITIDKNGTDENSLTGNFSFASDAGDWNTIMGSTRYGAENSNSAAIADLPATKALSQNAIDFSIPTGKYNIVVNLIDNTMYIEKMTWPENVYVLGNISRHHWKPDYTGAKMRMENDGKYHINGVKFETADQNTVAYFSLSTMTSAIWGEVNAKQYGAVASNTAIENEVETQVMKGENNWTLEPGIYDITFDFENLKISVKANSETNTIYYKPKDDEQTVYLYAYKSSEPVTRSGNVANAEWPGEPISVTDKKDNTGFIRCEVSNTYDKVEFNDGTNHGPVIDNVADRNYSSDIYIIGNVTAEGWKPNACRQLTQTTDNDKVIYQIPELIVAEKAGGQKNYFYLTATPAETEDDWETLNAGSFGAPEGNQTLVTDGKTPNPVVLGSITGWEIPAGKYEVKFKPAENVLIVTDLNTVGIENVDADAAGAEYYNIQGIRMNKSQKGLNIIRRNGKTYKTAIR